MKESAANKMKTVLYFHYGNPDVMTNGTAKIPTPLENEVLVKVHSCGINPIDYKVRHGKLKWITGKRFPKIPGSDFSGTVEISNSPDFKKGDRVAGMTNPMLGGAYAEFVRISADSLVKIPKNISFEEAAGICMSGLTALQSLRDKGNITKDSSVLIIGASGGVGTFAVQIAKIFGSHVTAISSNRNIKLVKSLGADIAIDYTVDNYESELGKYDIILDTVNSFGLNKARRYMNPGSVYIMTSPGMKDILTTLNPLNYQYEFKSIAVSMNQEDLKLLLDWIKEKSVKVVIDKVFQFNDAVNAHVYGESNRARGKLILNLQS